MRLRAAMAVLGSLSLALATTPAAQAAPDDGLVGAWEFNQATGTSVPNLVAGAPAATVVNGNDSQWTGDSLTFTGGAKTGSGNWVELPDDLLAGARSATVSTEVKIDASMKSSYNFLWNIGADANTTSYYFASVKDTPRTAITTSSNGGERNAGAKANFEAGRWYSLTSVIDGEAGTISLYVDGVLASTTATTLTPGSITNQSLNTIGRAPWPDPLFKGEVSAFRVWDRALPASDIAEVADRDAAVHADEFAAVVDGILDGVAPLRIDDDIQVLPTYSDAVTWESSDPALRIQDGAVVADLPESGTTTATLTARATVRGISATREVPVTLVAKPAADEAFGYLMVHFIEDSAGYAEKIYLDVSRGDNPEQWDPLNGGKAILASQLGTTGVRDPYLTYNPESKTWYIIATDLRVFGGDNGSGSCTSWCHWTKKASVKLNIWESQDLVTWSDLRQIDVTLDGDGVPQANLGMAWAPEATWVPDYNGEGEGAFVVYWSSNVYPTAEQTGTTYSRVLWGATTDFTQEDWAYGGVMIDTGANVIDTTVIQNDGVTYRLTKDNGTGRGIYMEKSESATWWLASTAWTSIQTRIGASWAGGNAGGVEGPAVFKRHDDDRWYLYVDVIPSTGYRPLSTTDLDGGWTVLDSPDFYMAPSTKHGGIVTLNRAQYDTVRAADATSAVSPELGAFTVEGDADAVRDALPATAEVELAYGRGTAELPVRWDVSPIDGPGTYEVTGVVASIGANLNDWVGEGGSTAWNARDRTLRSSTAIEVSASVTVRSTVSVAAATRCVAGKVTVVVTVTNPGEAAVTDQVVTPWGNRSLTVGAGRSSSLAFSTRSAAIGSGMVSFGGIGSTVQGATCGG
ncbi:Ig-like domain (group 4) [Tessaracoccus bendigoensis DSM 12906]|uniref:Ig-like domain (Group 4) n=1 Tax=Tessaracoccus bendigoensis DSM 12906 TaxID=1123357 RepID=A0A1M6J595_9ACTN|nr:LamG-like jellyroll fold domain-containing protein [Tessaracoccus bendigoensis]SHJ41863.1 Ig-like domain (group 4) [Tessaracoccus bendigoensis DSM 12906]